MRSPLSGSIATCLFFVPLVAVPLLAVLGMPQLSSSSPNSGAADDLKFAADDPALGLGNSDLVAPVRVSEARTDSATQHREPRTASRDSDPFAEFSRDSDAARGDGASAAKRGSSQPRSGRWNEGNGLPQKAVLSIDRASTDRASTDRASIDRASIDRSSDGHESAGPSDRPAASRLLDERTVERAANEASVKTSGGRRALPEAEAVVALASESSAASASADPAADPRASAEPQSASVNGSSWKRAVARLNALGIRDYQLQPGERDGEFNFSCRFAARGNPRVIHRFEAESADPLDAVNQVLRQLDDWRARHADGRAAARDSATDAAMTLRGADASEIQLTNRAF
jgi:hypothetical protein